MLAEACCYMADPFLKSDIEEAKRLYRRTGMVGVDKQWTAFAKKNLQIIENNEKQIRKDQLLAQAQKNLEIAEKYGHP